MPRLPKGIFARPGRRGYYTRLYRQGGERKVKLADDLETARRKLRELRDVDVPASRIGGATASECAMMPPAALPVVANCAAWATVSPRTSAGWTASHTPFARNAASVARP